MSGAMRVSPAWGLTPDAIPDPGYNLTVRIIDGVTEQVLPARVGVVGSDGRSLYPIPRRSHLYHQAYFGHKYFYAEDEFTIIVPPGPVRIQAMHGFEYKAVEETLDVQADMNVLVEMSPFLDMSALGWRSGDTHVHMNHGGVDTYDLTTADLFLMQRAEDVHVVNALENELNFTGHIDSISTPDHLLYFGIEYRSAFWGHLGVLGTSSLTSFGCCSRGQSAFPMNVDLTTSARSFGGTVIFAHPITMERSQMGVIDQGWPSVGHGRELPVDVALGEVDAIDVLSYSNKHDAEFSTWYDLLNHGFHIPATAGTDASVNRFNDPPLGGYRVYAQVGPGPWTYEGWLEAIRAGNTFVTNGPLIRKFKVANASIGDVVSMSEADAHHVFCNVEVSSQWPIDQAQIIVNGLAKGYLYPDGSSRTRITGGTYIDTGGGSAWVALKVSGYKPNPFTIGYELYAHTSPVYVTVSHKPILFAGTNPGYYIDWITDLWNLAVTKGFETPADYTTAEERIARAKTIIRNRTILGPDHDADPLPPPPEDGSLSPESAGGPVTIAPVAAPGGPGIAFRITGPGSLPETFELYDVSGRRVATRRVDQSEAESGTWTWRPGGLNLRAGIYFALFRGQDWSRSVRVAFLN